MHNPANANCPKNADPRNETCGCSPEVLVATVHNQYGRPLGMGWGVTRDEAIRNANTKADEELRGANPNWKWRKTKTTVGPWNGPRPDKAQV